MSKLHRVIGLTALQKAILQNMFFMSSRLEGTRQIRKMIGHLLTGGRIVYGLPVFMTVTPSERHSGWAIRFSRYRKSDPGVRVGSPEFTPYAGYNVPSLYGSLESEEADIDLPEYDLRRLMVNRDPLCALYAFLVNIKVVLANLYGIRMCPDCPHCVEEDHPCMDIYGSNATPMGGSAGRADAMAGAIEAQKAEGVLHIHLFMFLQMAFQFHTLKEITEMFRQELLKPDAWKRYLDMVKRASYPDPAAFEKERDDIEKTWPAYVQDKSLSRPPDFLVRDFDANVADSNLLSSARLQEGATWKALYDARLQHVLSHMNHHIHPLNVESGERKPLRSCCRKDRPKECKGGFPLESELLEEAMIVCHCLAEEKGWTVTGPRSVLGGVMPLRREPWQWHDTA